ncbi:hypothetical protein NPIL_14391 [Nephila pilipes]|uniref:Uncharacterized protein n=1 Tax=Nephila pilipes TaxID=299642 RepID=A0A8X6PER6_NEPPI|nr:hypothetical protein NPIL_14391 [Nephila pilipes]
MFKNLLGKFTFTLTYITSEEDFVVSRNQSNNEGQHQTVISTDDEDIGKTYDDNIEADSSDAFKVITTAVSIRKRKMVQKKEVDIEINGMSFVNIVVITLAPGNADVLPVSFRSPVHFYSEN